MRAWLIGLAVLIAPQAASAQTWRLAANGGTAPQDMGYFIDVDSIRQTGPLTSFRAETIYHQISGTRDFDRSSVVREVDCAANTSRITASDYYANGKLLGSEGPVADAKTITPGTVLARMVDVACGRETYLSEPVASPEAFARDKFAKGGL